MSGGRSRRHAQNPLSGERRRTLSITHHALSPPPPPSHHHMYIIHLINWLQRFYRITISLKRPFVPKSDIKQWFTTTTTTSVKIDAGCANPTCARIVNRHETYSWTLHYELNNCDGDTILFQWIKQPIRWKKYTTLYIHIFMCQLRLLKIMDTISHK